jgi:hypothetical protein
MIPRAINTQTKNIDLYTEMNLIDNRQCYFPKIYFNIILLSTPRYSECSLPFSLSNQNAIHISNLPNMPLRPLPFSSSLLRTTFCEEHKLQITLFCSFASFCHLTLFVQNVLLSVLLPEALIVCSFFNLKDQVQTQTKEQINL